MAFGLLLLVKTVVFCVLRGRAAEIEIGEVHSLGFCGPAGTAWQMPIIGDQVFFDIVRPRSFVVRSLGAN